MAVLYHASGYVGFQNLGMGDCITLIPGTQAAEGLGVYFAEGSVRISAADGCIQGGCKAIFSIEVEEVNGDWWRTKGKRAKKFGKARTWHSKNKKVECTVVGISSYEGIPMYSCEWKFV